MGPGRRRQHGRHHLQTAAAGPIEADGQLGGLQANQGQGQHRPAGGAEHLGLVRIGPFPQPHLLHPGGQGRAQQRAQVSRILETVEGQHKASWSGGLGLRRGQHRQHTVGRAGGGGGLQHLGRHRAQGGGGRQGGQ